VLPASEVPVSGIRNFFRRARWEREREREREREKCFYTYKICESHEIISSSHPLSQYRKRFQLYYYYYYYEQIAERKVSPISKRLPVIIVIIIIIIIIIQIKQTCKESKVFASSRRNFAFAGPTCVIRYCAWDRTRKKKKRKKKHTNALAFTYRNGTRIIILHLLYT
jgi:hypothetical protein